MDDRGHPQVAFGLRADHHRTLERIAQRRGLAADREARARDLDHQDGQRVDVDLVRDVAEGEVALVAHDGDVDGVRQADAVAFVLRVDGLLEVIELAARGVVDLLGAKVSVELVAVNVEFGVGRDHLAQQMDAADVGVGVGAALDLERAVSAFVELARLIGQHLVGGQPQDAARRDALAVAAQELVDRLAARFADDVPQRHVDAALGGEVALDEVHLLMDLLDVEGIEPDDQRRQMVVDDVHHARLRLAVDVLARDRLGNALDALVGHDAHQHMRLRGHAAGRPLHHMRKRQLDGDGAYALDLHLGIIASRSRLQLRAGRGVGRRTRGRTSQEAALPDGGWSPAPRLTRAISLYHYRGEKEDGPRMEEGCGAYSSNRIARAAAYLRRRRSSSSGATGRPAKRVSSELWARSASLTFLATALPLMART